MQMFGVLFGAIIPVAAIGVIPRAASVEQYRKPGQCL